LKTSEKEPTPWLPSFLATPRKLGMWLFIAADGTIYLAIVAAYEHSRVAGAHWPRPLTWWPSGTASIVMTAAVLLGSGAFFKASQPSSDVRCSRAARWVALAAISGLIFDILQVKLWTAVERNGIGLAHDAWGTPLFGGFFFVLTGLNSIHVTAGSVYSAVLACKADLRLSEAGAWETAAAYWWFVTAMWIVTFVLIVLPSIRPS
jgi:nitric oxide reductase NorE protein